MYRETRKTGTPLEAYGPVQKAQSSESRALTKLTLRAALRSRANKRKAALWRGA